MAEQKTKVVQLFNVDPNDRDAYIEEIHRVSETLEEISRRYGETLRATLSDLTYITVGNDIMDTIEEVFDDG